MLAKRESESLSFPLPLMAKQKWWDELNVNDVFKKGSTFRMFAGASCAGGAIRDDKQNDKLKPTNKTVSKKITKKTTTTKGVKKSGKK